jgi:hypothetical protein
MPTPTIPAGNLFMNATLYTGNSGTQSIVNGVAGQAFQPDFVWLKSRSNALDHGLNDSVRGVQKTLASNGTGAENYGGTGELTAFNSNGFTLVNSGSYQTNQSGYTYVAWQWKAGGTAVTNTSGSISSQVSANTTSGFSIVTYTGNGSTGATVGHGLGVTPAMIIVKKRSSTGNWITYHTSTGINQYLYLNSTSASATATPTWGVSSTTFTLQQSYSDYNDNGVTYVAYCWTPIAGYSAFGSYTGNGSADGSFVYLGFRPRFIMIKRSDTIANWTIRDTARNPYNSANLGLFPNLSIAEDSTSGREIDILSNGFKIRGTDSDLNTSSGTYTYACWAENPFKYSNAR